LARVSADDTVLNHELLTLAYQAIAD
jgi:hypothetical protein